MTTAWRSSSTGERTEAPTVNCSLPKTATGLYAVVGYAAAGPVATLGTAWFSRLPSGILSNSGPVLAMLSAGRGRDRSGAGCGTVTAYATCAGPPGCGSRRGPTRLCGRAGSLLGAVLGAFLDLG